MELISVKLSENITCLKELFKNAMDFTAREFKIGECDAVLLSLDGLINKQQAAISILNPLMDVNSKLTGNTLLEYISSNSIGTADEQKLYKISEITEKMFLGFAVLLIGGAG